MWEPRPPQTFTEIVFFPIFMPLPLLSLNILIVLNICMCIFKVLLYTSFVETGNRVTEETDIAVMLCIFMRGAGFETWSGHRLPWLRSSVVFSVPAGKYRATNSPAPQPILCQFFQLIIHQLINHSATYSLDTEIRKIGKHFDCFGVFLFTTYLGAIFRLF
jgi:hypothetical protein